MEQEKRLGIFRVGENGTGDLPKSKPAGLGDVIERIAKPIARALKLNCLDGADELKPESPCAKRRNALNRAFPFKSA